MYKQIQIKSVNHSGIEEVILGKGSKDVVVRMTINKVDVNGPWGIKDWMLRVWMADTEDFANKEWRWPFGINQEDRRRLYQVSWTELMERQSIQWLEWEWNHAALRALLLVLAATHHRDFSEFTLDLQNDRWWHDSAPLDAEPAGLYVPRVTDAPRRPGRRRSPKRSDTSATSSAPSSADGSPTCGALRPRVLFRTSRLSEEPKPCEPRGSIRWGSRTHPHQVVDGDYLCDGKSHARVTGGRAENNWQWRIFPDKIECTYRHSAVEEPEHTMEDDNGLPLDPLWPMSPMSPALVEPPTPIYVEE